MSTQPDPHAELGVPPTATAAEVHQAFRRRLREHHPDTRPQQDDTTDSASDQALQRALVASQTLRHQAAPPPVESPTESEPRTADLPAPRSRSGSLGDAPFTATPVHWVPAAGTGLSPTRRSTSGPLALSQRLHLNESIRHQCRKVFVAA
jgi:hypothetical protein